MTRLIFLLVALACPASAHEFWLEPEAYQVEADGMLEAEIVNGQQFGGVKLAYIPQRIASFTVYAGVRSRPVEMRLGASPALAVPVLTEGLNIIAYQSTVATVSYDEWEKFARFVAHKDLPVTLEAHLARGLPEAGFSEAYFRFSKTLIGAGNARGADRRVGLETELVALDNPYADDLAGGLHVQLFYLGEIRADAQVEIFEKAADGTVAITTTRTDADGIATIPVRAGMRYMLDAVVLREPSPALAASTGAVWETLWANLTFAVPQ